VRPVASGERFVVCSDGLSNELDDETIHRLVTDAGDDPQAGADALVAAALEAGGRDNVTVVVLGVDAE
jgi:protein phosphatase